MRIARFAPHRYGQFTDAELTFPAAHGLHVVFGANEAGKSTALAALGDALFGFGHSSPHGWLYPQNTLKIGMTIENTAGARLDFIRTKARKTSLTDAQDRPLDPSVLTPFLGSTDRVLFDTVFGLSGEGLRRGGLGLLKDHGAGSAVMGAQIGRLGIQRTRNRLVEEADRLYGTRRKASRTITVATDILRDLRSRIAARARAAADHAHLQDEAASLHQRLGALDHEIRSLRARQNVLNRIVSTHTARAGLRRAREALAELGPIPRLPEDAATQVQAARRAFDTATADVARHQHEDAVLAEQEAALQPDPAILAEHAAVTALAAQRSEHVTRRGDLAKQRTVAAERERDMDRAAARLGLSDRGAALRGRIPPVPLRHAAQRLLNRLVELRTQHSNAQRALAEAEAEEAEAARVLAATPAPGPLDEQRERLAAAQAESKIDDELDSARVAHEAAAARATAALAALPLWTGTAEQLEALPLPPEPERARCGGALDAADAACAAAAADVLRCQAALASTEAELKGVEAAGPIPTAEAVASVRARRDAAWQTVLRQLEGGPADPQVTPASFKALIDEADSLADLRWTEAERLAKANLHRADAARRAALLATATASAQAAAAAHAVALAAWHAAWTPCALVPLAPSAMQAWCKQRTDVLALHAAAQEAARAVAARAARRDRVLASLASLTLGAPATSRAADLISTARRILTEREKAGTAHETAKTAVADAQKRRQKARTVLDGIETRRTTWSTEWQQAAAPLGIQTIDPEDAGAALELWTTIDSHHTGWADATQRVALMQTALDTYDQDLAVLAARLGVTPHDTLVPDLAARLARADKTADAAARIAEARHTHGAALAEAAARRAAAEATLAALRTAAGVQDDSGLEAALARVAAHAALHKEIAARASELATQGEGHGEAELDAEAAGRDIDAVKAERGQLAEQLAVLDAERIELVAKQAEHRVRSKELARHHDVAGPAQEMANQYAIIEQEAARYVRLRLAARLLDAGLEAWRRAQQGPLLAEASRLFAALTAHRYERLDADETEKGDPTLLALRPDGTGCAADHLSEGTRDQLYLALRLAALTLQAQHAETLPFIADDLLASFDDARARAALHVMAEFGRTTQVILFTHHDHIGAMAREAGATLQRLG